METGLFLLALIFMKSVGGLLLSGKHHAMSFSKTRFSSKSDSMTDTQQTMAHVAKCINEIGPKLIADLNSKGYCYVDNFLGTEFCKTLRKEAVSLYETNKFVTSQSTRWCSIENKPIYYDKHNVFSTQLEGGEAYFDAPRLHEYVVSCVKTIVPILRSEFPHAMLDERMASNKLAVCVGDGSAYDKHYDNSGMDDTRKVTVLYYLNPSWRTENGGLFRIYNPEGSPRGEFTDVEPMGDRMLVFWSDVLVHSVQPSFAQKGAYDHRYALTIWLTASTPGAIVRDDAEIKRHFG